jgi:hypothetical protein
MSSEHTRFAETFAAALQTLNRDPSKENAPAPNDTDRLVALIEAARAKFDANDAGAVEELFAMQGVMLDVIFTDFIRRRYFTFDNMRVALRAQAQCRATFKTLKDFKHPRPGSSAKNSSEQTVESTKTSAC